MAYYATKTYGNERGLSCAFRQWRADSHCNLIHGYAIGVRIVFKSNELDFRNWVFDFGDTVWIRKILETQFDHTTIISSDDPFLPMFKELNSARIVDLRIMDGVGCEKFAEYIYNQINDNVLKRTNSRVSVKSVEVFEHGSNSATYEG